MPTTTRTRNLTKARAEQSKGLTRSQLAARVAELTADAYSYNRYANWRGVASALIAAGYSAPQAASIMRSKWTRWAGDNSDKSYGHYTSNDLLAWIEKSFPLLSDCVREAEKLHAESKGFPGDGCNAEDYEVRS